MPEALLRFFGRLADRVEAEVLEAEEGSMDELLRIAQGLSLGPISSKQLRRMGHPYATRAPAPPLPPYLVNKQSGTFLRSWQVIPARRTAAGYVSQLVNLSPQASLLMMGTDKMIRRPFDLFLRRAVRQIRREERIARALSRAVRDAVTLLD